MLLPPDLADPRSKAMIDAYIEVRQRHRAHRAWRMWLLVFGASIAALWLAQYEWIHPYARPTSLGQWSRSSGWPWL